MTNFFFFLLLFCLLSNQIRILILALLKMFLAIIRHDIIITIFAKSLQVRFFFKFYYYSLNSKKYLTIYYLFIPIYIVLRKLLHDFQNNYAR